MAITKVTNNGVADNAITSDKISDGSIANADISSSAAIVGSKLTSISASSISSGTLNADRLGATLDLSSKTVTLPSASITAHATNPTKSSIEALGIDVPASNLTGIKTVGGVSIAGSGDISVDTVTKSASDPAITTNGAVGDQWVNTTSGEMFVCTDATTDENVWTNVGEGVDNIVPLGAYFGERGLSAGGENSGFKNTIEYVTIATTGNATDFGDLTQARNGCAGMSGYGRGIITKGNFGTSGAGTTIDYVTIATTGNATDFGDTSVPGDSSAASSDGTRGLIWNGGHSCTQRDDIDYITIATTGNASDFGNATMTGSRGGALGNNTRGLCFGGWYCFTSQNHIDYVTYSTTGNASDFGDMLYAGTTMKGTVSDGTRGVFGGTEYGTSSNWSNMGGMEYVTIATTGNSVGFGNFNVGNGDGYGHNGTSNPGASNNSTRGVFFGGAPYYSVRNNIDYITIQTTGDATDFGDLSAAISGNAGLSGD